MSSHCVKSLHLEWERSEFKDNKLCVTLESNTCCLCASWQKCIFLWIPILSDHAILCFWDRNGLTQGKSLPLPLHAGWQCMRSQTELDSSTFAKKRLWNVSEVWWHNIDKWHSQHRYLHHTVLLLLPLTPRWSIEIILFSSYEYIHDTWDPPTDAHNSCI